MAVYHAFVPGYTAGPLGSLAPSLTAPIAGTFFPSVTAASAAAAAALIQGATVVGTGRQDTIHVWLTSADNAE